MPSSETPIYDQVVLDHALNDPEGRGLVEAILERQRQRLLAMDRVERQAQAVVHRPLRMAALFPFGLLR